MSAVKFSLQEHTLVAGSSLIYGASGSILPIYQPMRRR